MALITQMQVAHPDHDTSQHDQALLTKEKTLLREEASEVFNVDHDVEYMAQRIENLVTRLRNVKNQPLGFFINWDSALHKEAYELLVSLNNTLKLTHQKMGKIQQHFLRHSADLENAILEAQKHNMRIQAAMEYHNSMLGQQHPDKAKRIQSRWSWTSKSKLIPPLAVDSIPYLIPDHPINQQIHNNFSFNQHQSGGVQTGNVAFDKNLALSLFTQGLGHAPILMSSLAQYRAATAHLNQHK